MPMLKRPMQPVMMQQKPNILEQNAQMHQQEPAEKEKNLPGIILGILVLIVVILVGIFAYFYFTR